MKSSLISQLLVFMVSFSGLGIALWCYLVDRKKVVNQLFASLVVLIVLNIFLSFLLHQPFDDKWTVFWVRLIWVTGSLLIPVFYFFAINFPTKIKSYSFLNILFIILGAVFTLLSLFSNLIVKGISARDWGNEIVYGSGNNFFYAALVAAFIAGVWIIIKKYIQSVGKEKTQIRLFLIGIVVYFTLSIIFSILFPIIFKTTQYYYLGDYSAIVLVGFVAYAIMKHQLFNIKVIATESIVIVLSIGLLVEVFFSNSSTLEGVIKAIIWVLATYGGWTLIKSVRVEIEQKESLEKLAKELEAANEHLKSVDKLKDDFLSMASHELNTPIAAIEGYLSMILEEHMAGDLSPKAEQYLTSVFNSSKRLAGMVKDLLNVSRIESNRVHLIMKESQIDDLITQVEMEIAPKVKQAKHTLIYHKPAKAMPLTWMDNTRITEVLINIIGNAIKYTPDGGKIEVNTMCDDKKIVVSVKDNGKGIPKDKFGCVFEKFTQVDVLKDEVKGTGLGMYISKRFVELHKGKIWFTSEGDGKGSTFFFSIPVLEKQPFDPHAGEGDVLH